MSRRKIDVETAKRMIRSKINLVMVEKLAAKLDAQLRADDKRLNGAVHLVHMDTTSLFFDRAFALYVRSGEELEDEEPAFLVVLSEHHGHHVYRNDDLRIVRTYKMGAAIEEIKR